MEIKQIHLSEVHSTQDYLKNQVEIGDFQQNQTILVSCDTQTSGQGRRGRDWIQYPGTLCFSFTLSPHPTFSWSTIEIALLVREFIEKKWKKRLLIKWPNDLLDYEGKKVAGILCDFKNNSIIVGVGLNLLDTKEMYDDFGAVGVLTPINYQEISYEIVEYVLTEGHKDIDWLKLNFNSYCNHLNQLVTISDEKDIQGEFVRIGNFGEAVLRTVIGEHAIYSGTLRVSLKPHH